MISFMALKNKNYKLKTVFKLNRYAKHNKYKAICNILDSLYVSVFGTYTTSCQEKNVQHKPEIHSIEMTEQAFLALT